VTVTDRRTDRQTPHDGIDRAVQSVARVKNYCVTDEAYRPVSYSMLIRTRANFSQKMFEVHNEKSTDIDYSHVCSLRLMTHKASRETLQSSVHCVGYRNYE